MMLLYREALKVVKYASDFNSYVRLLKVVLDTDGI